MEANGFPGDGAATHVVGGVGSELMGDCRLAWKLWDQYFGRSSFLGCILRISEV